MSAELEAIMKYCLLKGNISVIKEDNDNDDNAIRNDDDTNKKEDDKRM